LRIAFDNQIFMRQRTGGVSRYYCELGRELKQIPEYDVRIVSPVYINETLRISNLNPNGFFLPFKPYTFGFSKASDNLSYLLSRKEMRTFHPQIIHETFFSYEDLWKTDAKRVLTIFDLTRELIETDERKIYRLKAAVNRADFVICISENTRKDLLSLINLDKEKVQVVYLGVSDVFNKKKVENDAKRQEKILYVGKRDGYKNFVNFLQAFANSRDLIESFQIEVFGGGTFTKFEKDLILKLGIKNQILKTEGNDAQLANSYASSTAFVYPSLHEGFGLPILEAMASGCPVLCSSINSFFEVAGSAANYFDGNSVDSITEVLVMSLGSESKLKSLQEKGYENIKRFSWGKCARETSAIYSSVL